MAAPPRPKTRARTTERPALDRRRRVLPDEERLEMGAAAARAEAAHDRMLSAARSGHNELRNELGRHTEAGPELTAGDVDARWQDAYAVGDEAPGGDNPTPDQDRVDDIGRALGIQYQDDQELQGGDEVTERDKHRWELDPASSDDWPHENDRGLRPQTPTRSLAGPDAPLRSRGSLARLAHAVIRPASPALLRRFPSLVRRLRRSALP